MKLSLLKKIFILPQLLLAFFLLPNFVHAALSISQIYYTDNPITVNSQLNVYWTDASWWANLNNGTWYWEAFSPAPNSSPPSGNPFTPAQMGWSVGWHALAVWDGASTVYETQQIYVDNPAPVVNGTCYFASETNDNQFTQQIPFYTSLPSNEFCLSGTSNGVAGMAPNATVWNLGQGGYTNGWGWQCAGSGGGTTVNCSAAFRPPTVSIQWSPASISSGGYSTIIWSSSDDAEYCEFGINGVYDFNGDGNSDYNTAIGWPFDASWGLGPYASNETRTIRCHHYGRWVEASATLTVAPPIYALTVTKSGSGTGTVASSPAGISCGADCSESYTSGTVVTLTASPSAGSTFSGWSGGGCSGTGTCTVSMTAAQSVTATFNLSTYTVSYNAGTATSGTAPSSQTKTYGVNLTLQTNTGSLARTGYTFVGWDTASDGSGTDYASGGTYSANAAVTLYPRWTINSYTITATQASNGSITPSGATSVVYGSNQTYTITANANYYVASLIIDGTTIAGAPSYSFTNVTANHTISAVFTASACANGATNPPTCTCSAGYVLISGTCTLVTVSVSATTPYNTTPNTNVSFAYTPTTNSGTTECRLLDNAQASLTAYQASSPIVYASPNGVSSYGYYVQCRNTTTTTATAISNAITVNTACAAGSTWNGSSCIANVAISTFTSSPANPITYNTPATLSWTGVTGGGTVTCSINNGVGAATPIPAGSKNSANLTANTTFIITCGNGVGPNATKSVAVTVGSAPVTGTLTPSATSCVIAAGASTCTVTMTWVTTNTTAPALVDRNTGGTLSTLANNATPFTVWVSNPTTTFDLKNGATILDTDVISGSCAAGSTWNGSSCIANVAISTFTSSPANPITYNTPATLSWTGVTGGGTVTCSINNGVGAATPIPAGSKNSANLTANTTFIITCGNGVGPNATKSVAVTVGSAPVIPTVTLPTATSITTTGATLGATVTSNGGAALTARGTCWGTTATPVTNCLAEGGTAVSAFTHARTGMPVGTTIYYRGYATNSAGTGYSEDATFVTVSNLPTVVLVPPATSITATGATLSANVTSNGGFPLTGRGTCWGTTSAPTSNCANKNPYNLGSFNHNRNGMPVGTLIYYRGYAENQNGRGYSEDGTFTTLPTISVSVTPSAVNTSQTFRITMASVGATSCTWSRTSSYGDDWTNEPVPALNTSYDVVHGPWAAGNATWTFVCTNAGGSTLPASGSVTVTNPSYTLTVAKAGTGSGTITSSPVGINCGVDCSESYTSGTVVTLTAAFGADSIFDGWSGGGCSGTGTCVVTMSAAQNVTAAFTALVPTATLSADPTSIDKGQFSTLTWDSANAASCEFSGTPPNGISTNGNPSGFVSTGILSTPGTYNYQVDCSGALAPATVEVLAPGVTISAIPDLLRVGSTTVISWNANDVNSCAVTRNNAAWLSGLTGAELISSAPPVEVRTQTVFAITCQTNGSQVAASTTVNVTGALKEF